MKIEFNGKMFEVSDEIGKAILLEREETKQKQQELIENREFEAYFISLDNTQRIPALLNLSNQMTDEAIFECLAIIVPYADNIIEDWIKLDKLIKYKDPTLRKLMMNEDELAKFESWNSDDVITIYRGCRKNNQFGFSWSLNKEIAIRFTTVYQNKKQQSQSMKSEEEIIKFVTSSRMVITGEVVKKNIYAYFNTREEEEIFVNPEHVKILTTENLED